MIDRNKTEIINNLKLLIYKERPALLDKIDFEDDNTFLEPLLFPYFNSKRKDSLSTGTLEEIMQGYSINKDNSLIRDSYNANNIAYIPKIGYFKKGEDKLFEPLLIRDDFEIVKEVHPLLEKYFVEFYKGHIVNSKPQHNSVWKQNYKELYEAITIIKTNLPEFYKELVFANRKIYLHDNPKIINFTSIETLGMLYFYVLGNNNLIYFIEELIHQGSHNFLYYVIHNRKEYFKIDVDNLLMRDFTKQKWDYRTIYGAFHGLFTVTQRVECFDKLIMKNIFTGRDKHELFGRLTDQFARFRTGLELLNFSEVFTDKGMNFYKQLDTKCESILNKYSKLKDEFDLSNRDLDFRYDDFCKFSPIEEFNEDVI